MAKKDKEKERPISEAYREIDNDLARDNLENDIPFADLQDLEKTPGHIVRESIFIRKQAASSAQNGSHDRSHMPPSRSPGYRPPC